MNRRHFNKFLITTAAAALAPFNIVRAQAAKLKIGVLLPDMGSGKPFCCFVLSRKGQ